MGTPAQELSGLILEGGWKVVSKVERPAKATGGCFSCGYIVESPTGRKGYLKALDYSRALSSVNPAEILQAMTEAFNFELKLCNKCIGKRLKRVVAAIGNGKVTVREDDPSSVVQYLMFELADADVRAYLDTLDEFDIAWLLRALHHVATGLQELHSAGIAHQDLKPSNVLVFREKGSKVADLGRAVYRGAAGPHDELEIPGDISYAPPELLYGHVGGEWNLRRFGCDDYLLGSMVVFLFGRASMSGLLFSEMDEAYHWRTWSGTFEEVLPYLRDAFGRAVRCFSQDVPCGIRDEICTIVRQLCEPDPRQRGHPLNRLGRGNQYSLERYVSQFDLLASKAEYGLLKR
jgi:serine/threonine protein kinase